MIWNKDVCFFYQHFVLEEQKFDIVIKRVIQTPNNCMLNKSGKHFLGKYLFKNGNPAIFVDVLIGFHCSMDQ